jgi:hypothetical protein
MAGFNFVVLREAFVVHRGFKVATGFHITKDAEQAANRILFRRFKEELKARYPAQTRRCHN